MEIVIPGHAREQAAERGVVEDEIREAILRGRSTAAHSGRRGAELVVPYQRRWGRKGRFYEQKRILVYYVEQDDKAVVVTVISQFGEWKA